MELATNTFTKGLQMDTNPMVLGTDTLTDCLNGTLITMNGNEVILLNDMGNRRVDNAFLPPGYQPVGMKEYGGVIYVAAYNPITNKSLIGSFPSPERKIDGENLGGEFIFDLFINDNYILDSDLGILVLKTDSFLIPLTDETSIRTGDKFTIYSPYLYTSNNNILPIAHITNYHNTIIVNGKKKVISPKNKEYTLAVGILNSLNEFVDITKTLCRWDNSTLITYDEETSDLYKFNDGYFIAKSFSNESLANTIADGNLIKERLALAMNTYAYKLIGPMYLKASLNHIENFNYNIYGILEGAGYTLWIEGYLNYNCPDNVTVNTPSNSNNDYNSFEEGKFNPNTTKILFDLIDKTAAKTTITDSVYNPATNLYSTKIVKEFQNITANVSDTTQFEYVLGVPSGLDVSNSPIYLKGLSVKGIIDLGLLGSGTVAITGWRFYNNTEKTSTTLTFSFNAYPKFLQSFNNLTFKFIDIEINAEVWSYEGLPLYNGRQTIQINWDGKLQKRKVYKVKISYNVIDSATGTVLSTEVLNENDRWFITTDLFNEFYTDSNILDFCKVNVDNPNGENYNEAFANKMKVDFSAYGEFINNTKSSESFEGSLISSESPNIKYVCNHDLNINLVSKHYLRILDEELYPDFVTIDEDNLNIDTVETLSIGGSNIPLNSTVDREFKNHLIKTTGTAANLESNIDAETVIEVNNATIIEEDRKAFTQKVIYRDIYVGTGTRVTLIENVFKDFEEVFGSNVATGYDGVFSSRDSKHAGVIANFNGDGSNSDHFVDVAVKHDGYLINLLLLNADYDNNYRVGKKENNELPYTFYFESVADDVYDVFNKTLNNPGQMFLFVFLSGKDRNQEGTDWQYYTLATPGITGSNYDDDSKTIAGEFYTRLWWRTSYNEWATFDDLFYYTPYGLNNNLNPEVTVMAKEFVETKMRNKNYVYCMYLVYNGNDINLYTAKDDFIHYNSYDIPLVLQVNFEETNLGESITSLYSIGNLQFKQGTLKPIEDNLITFNLKSSKTFHNTINKFNPEVISNIYVYSGGVIMEDSENKPFDLNWVYTRVMDPNDLTKVLYLTKVQNCPFKPDFNNVLDNGKTPFVYCRYFKGRPKYPYLVGYSSYESKTIINFSSVNLISL